MKILHVIRTMDPAWGGPVEGLKNIAAQAAVRGHDLQVTCLDEPHAAWLKGSEVHVNAIGPATLGKFGYSRRLDSWLELNIKKFDVVVANGIWMYFSSAVRRAAIQANKPYCVFTHGALDPWFRRNYPSKQIKKHIYWFLFEHKVLRDAAAVLFTTVEEQVVSDCAFFPYICNPEVVGYGIGDPFISQGHLKNRPEIRKELRRALPSLGNRQFLLFLARIHEKKGVDLLLHAIKRNREAYQDYAFVIAGPGEKSYLRELKTLGSRLGLEQQLVWAGPLYGELKWAAISEADAYVLPSHQENFGISVVEALACGIPVLITNKVNIWREIVAEGCGLAEDDDLNGVSRLLKGWSELQVERRHLMRNCARPCFLNHFDIATTSTNLFNVLQQFVQSRNS